MEEIKKGRDLFYQFKDKHTKEELRLIMKFINWCYIQGDKAHNGKPYEVIT